MLIVLNGKEEEINNINTVKELLDNLCIDDSMITVRLNKKIIAHEYYYNTYLKEGDNVEVIQFMGGG